MSTSLLMVGDVHVSDRPPTTRTDSYREDILLKLFEVGEVAQRERVNGVVFVGDIFHSKKPANTSHQTVRAVCQILQSYPSPVYIVPGNHDYSGANVDTLSKHPLGTVSLMPNVTLFGTKEHRSVMVGSSPITRLWGVREEEGLEAFEVEDKTMTPWIEHSLSMPTIVVAHSAIFPPGRGPTAWEAFDAREIAGQYALTGAPTLTWYGHIHEPHGTYPVVGGSMGEYEFANFGAISRGSIHEGGAMDRKVAIGHVVIEEGGNYEITELYLDSMRPAEEVFRVMEIRSDEAGEREVNAYVDALSAAEVEGFSVEKAISELSQHPGAPQSVRDRAVELVKEAQG